FALGKIVEANGAVVVFPIIRPSVRTTRVRNDKAFSIKVAQEVLLAGTSLRSTRIQSDLQCPHIPGTSLRRNTQEVRACRVSVNAAGGSEVGELGPHLQVRWGKQAIFVLSG